MKKEALASHLGDTLGGLESEDLPGGAELFKGKVRDIVNLPGEMIILTSDRISAFDRILSTIPCKGEVLNLLSLHWFDETRDIMPNHILEKISPRTVRVRKCEVLPVEIIVRGYLTGSAWRDYQAGKAVSGIALPPGMKLNQRFETPLLTPSTKAKQGAHDRPISSAQVVSTGLVSEALWGEVEEKALTLFARGREGAAERGLILVDTKYEFGLLDGRLIIVDEIHTPDSSRYWFADTYGELFARGEPQRKIDKEYLRQWLMERGFMGDGEPPEIPDEVRIETAWRYIRAYQLIRGEDFIPAGGNPADEAALIRARL